MNAPPPPATALASSSSSPPDHGTKRRARRVVPKVSRRKLSDSDDGNGDGSSASSGYVEFLQFIRSPPGVTLDDVRRRGEAARLAAAAGGSRPAAGDGRGGMGSDGDSVVDEQCEDDADDALISGLASLALVSGRRGSESRDNYSALTSMLDADDGVPDLDELSPCSSEEAQSQSQQGVPNYNPATTAPRETSADEVLAWTALGMLLGHKSPPLPQSNVKSGKMKMGSVAFAWGDEAVPELPPARYDSMEATSTCRTSRVDDLLTSMMCGDNSSDDGSDESSKEEDPRMADQTGAAPGEAMRPAPVEDVGATSPALRGSYHRGSLHATREDEGDEVLAGGVEPREADPRGARPTAAREGATPRAPEEETLSFRPGFRKGQSPARQPAGSKKPRGFVERVRERARRATPGAIRRGLRRTGMA